MKKTLTSAVCAGLIAGGTIFGAGISHANPTNAPSQEQAAKTDSQLTAEKVVTTALGFHNDQRFKDLKQKYNWGSDNIADGFDSSGYLSWLYHNADPKQFTLRPDPAEKRDRRDEQEKANPKDNAKPTLQEVVPAPEEGQREEGKILLSKMLFEQAEDGKNSANLEIVPFGDEADLYKDAQPGDIIGYEAESKEGHITHEWLLVVEAGAAKVQHYGENGPKVFNKDQIKDVFSLSYGSGFNANKQTPIFIMRPSVIKK